MKAILPTGVTTLRYDPLGRLYEIATGSSVTRLLHGPGPGAGGDELVAEYDGGGALLLRYVHGAGVDDPIAWYEGSAAGAQSLRHLLADRKGSIVAIAGTKGNVTGRNAYDEYGNPSSSDNGVNLVGRFGYTGQAWIPELGLYYYKARFYSSTLGRFLQTDPIGYEGGVNLYGYVGNDPVNATDPSGLEAGSIAYFSIEQLRLARGDRPLSVEERILTAATVGLVSCAIGCEALVAWGGNALRTEGVSIFRGQVSAVARTFAQDFRRQIATQFNRRHISGLAKAIRHELRTENLVGGKSHIIKGQDAIRWVNNRLKDLAKNAEISAAERQSLTKTLSSFRKQIEEALRTVPRD